MYQMLVNVCGLWVCHLRQLQGVISALVWGQRCWSADTEYFTHVPSKEAWSFHTPPAIQVLYELVPQSEWYIKFVWCNHLNVLLSNLRGHEKRNK